jgi:prolyl oligopeptidase
VYLSALHIGFQFNVVKSALRFSADMQSLACVAQVLLIFLYLQPLSATQLSQLESSRTSALRGSEFSRHLLGRHFSPSSADADTDAYAWLEDVSGQRVMSWVKSENEKTLAALGDPTASPLFTRVRNILESKDRIAFVHKIGDYLYNLWNDDIHVRGLWRRTTLEEYKKKSPKWETVIDVDALDKKESESWVWRHYVVLREPGRTPDLVLVHLSRGGADAVVVREFNLTSKEFLPAPQGFVLPEAKSDVAYLDRNTVLVGTDFGEGSMTSSGYPRTIRQWKRGTDLKHAPVYFEGHASDVSVHAYRVHDRRDCIYDFRGYATSFWESENWIRVVAGPGASKGYTKLDLPADAAASTFATALIVQTRSAYAPTPKVSFPAGSLIAMPVAKFLDGTRDQWTVLFQPDDDMTLTGFTPTRDFIVLHILHAVKVKLDVWRFDDTGAWVHEGLGLSADKTAPQITTINIFAVDPEESNALWVEENSFLVPTTMSLAPSAAKPREAERLKALPEMFNITGLVVKQQWAESKDGTRIPYFLVSHSKASGPQPTLLYGYGGFRIPQLPFYSPAIGALWLERGGAFALANIRGGGEFGPSWHQAAVKEKKHKSFEDFAAVAQHLVSSGVASTSTLGIMGGSNGGFLVGNMLVKYPTLFGAAVAQVPLLDMKRYNKLLAGASWMAEYGNPDDPKDWAFLRENSPYHIVDSHVHYPPVLFITSTRDDRVHPSHARKMVAKMQSFGAEVAQKTFLYENVEGGHGAAADAKQSAMVATLEYGFLWKELHRK